MSKNTDDIDCLGPDYVLPFGKYKGQTVKEILTEDPGWLIWAHSNVNGFKLQTDLLKEAAARKEMEDEDLYGDPSDRPGAYGFFDW